MPSLLESTCNTRSVLPGSLRWLRSDAPTAPTVRDIAFLLENSITHLVDLRSEKEKLRHPCPLAEHPSFSYNSLPVAGGNVMPDSVADVAPSYIRMVDQQMAEIIRTIETSREGVLFFCTAGKDRTGVVSAILQHRAGLSREEIVADYLLSRDNVAQRLTAFGQQHPEIDPAIYTPRRQYMEHFLDWLAEHEIP